MMIDWEAMFAILSLVVIMSVLEMVIEGAAWIQKRWRS